MCTVSVLRGPWLGGSDGVERPAWRLVCNRDEQRARAAALAPRVGRIGDRQVASPLDPQGPGTWIAASDAGLAFVLLNRTPRGAPVPDPPTGSGAPMSRGRLIPMLAGAADLDDVRLRARHLGPLRTRPFTLLIVGDHGVLEYASDGDVLEGGILVAVPRLFRTSSSVDEAAVTAWRADAFDAMVADGDRAAQQAFHRVTDREAPHRGVLMDRPDACTVSVSRIDMFATRARMTHEAVLAGATCTVLEVARRPTLVP
jgi:hypothetical protein